VIETDVEQFMTGAEYGPRKDEHMREMIKTVGGDLLFELQYCKPDPQDPHGSWVGGSSRAWSLVLVGVLGVIAGIFTFIYPGITAQ
jgi:hypothetical protein